MKVVNILGINLVKASKDEILDKIHSFLRGDKVRYIVTPNPENILKAVHDEELWYITNNADLSLADGIGLKLAGILMGKYLKRFTGSDLTNYLIDYAEKNSLKIAILNWRGGLSLGSTISETLNKKHPKLNFYIQDIDRQGTLINYEKLNKFSPDILFSSLGCPYQEKNIYEVKDKVSGLKLALAIGGSFDFITERKKRAPLFFRKIGLEWFWRLLIQPNRVGRIFNATFVFMYRFLIWRFIHPFLYRPSVACLLYKKEHGRIKILMVRRNEGSHEEHWQIPQGGTDGESLSIAGRRELNEELGNSNFKNIAVFKSIHKYLFPNGLRSKYNTDAKAPQGYKGQKQGLFIAEFNGKDSDISLNFWEHDRWKWVDLENAIETTHQTRKKSLSLFIQKLKTKL